ncbi:MAG: hypothetical protein GX337_09880 [Christensenellaceae bacterium]|jgi:hypothetical protein|nr:hypothetical protein [Christensenellaceae bacterium]
MIAKLPYLDAWDVTPCEIVLHGGLGDDGGPEEVGRWKGLVNFSEKARRVQDKDGQWVKLAGVIHVKGDILPGVQFTEGTAKIEDFPARKIIGYSRPRNPDGSVNHTRLELI